jgi:PadR family transcriptional regulator PadR
MTAAEIASDKFAPLRKGLLEFLVLKIVAAHKVYAADILARLQATDFTTGEGTLYPLLSRLRREGLLDYEWVESEAGPPRKYYRLTDEGRAQLGGLKDYWRTINETVENIDAVKPAKEAGHEQDN